MLADRFPGRLRGRPTGLGSSARPFGRRRPALALSPDRGGLFPSPPLPETGAPPRPRSSSAGGDLWGRGAPLLPVRPPRRHRYPGRLPADDRAALRGIVYVLCKGVSWRDVPAERIGRSGATAWRRQDVLSHSSDHVELRNGCPQDSGGYPGGGRSRGQRAVRCRRERASLGRTASSSRL
ncbi:transposase [Streptomyces antimycoticus]|uniref:transposase n=1 Tax=Streptomyces antimycoticus TaxID=68175 RepID=UPI003F4D530C